MALGSDTLGELLFQSDALEAILDRQEQDLAWRWAQAWDDVAAEFRSATARYATNPGATATVRIRKAQEAMNVVGPKFQEMCASAGVRLTDDTKQLLDLAQDHQFDLMRSQFPHDAAGMGIKLNRVDVNQMKSITSRAGEQITSRMRALSEEATDAIKTELISGVALGRNSVTVARLAVDKVQGHFEGGLARAVVIARTEQMDAYRAAGKAVQLANKDVLAGWQWVAKLDARTCPSCLKQHGSIHPLDEDGPLDHHQGKCSRAPLTKSWAELGLKGVVEGPRKLLLPGDGPAWFKVQNTAVQRKILGPKRFEAWRFGKFPDSMWSVKRVHPGWRSSFGVGPVPKGYVPPVKPVKPPTLPKTATPGTRVKKTPSKPGKTPSWHAEWTDAAAKVDPSKIGYRTEITDGAGQKARRLRNLESRYGTLDPDYLRGQNNVITKQIEQARAKQEELAFLCEKARPKDPMGLFDELKSAGEWPSGPTRNWAMKNGYGDLSPSKVFETWDYKIDVLEKAYAKAARFPNELQAELDAMNAIDWGSLPPLRARQVADLDKFGNLGTQTAEQLKAIMDAGGVLRREVDNKLAEAWETLEAKHAALKMASKSQSTALRGSASQLRIEIPAGRPGDPRDWDLVRAFWEETERPEVNRAILSVVRPTGGTQLTLSPIGNANGLIPADLITRMRGAESTYPTAWLDKLEQMALQRNPEGPRTWTPGIRVQQGARGGWTPDGYDITLSGSGTHTAMHEIGHGMEEAVDGLTSAEWAFHYTRTTAKTASGSTLRDASQLIEVYGKGSGEWSYEDNWLDKYTGKYYQRGATIDPSDHFEVFTTGVESVFDESKYVLNGQKRDLEFYDFILGVISTL